jgi:group 4 capsule polysaccharide lipoprotein GfcB/YjbF
VNRRIHGPLARRAAWSVAALTLILTGGCSSAGSGNTNYSQFYQIMKTSLAATMGKVRVTREQAAAIPYASMGYSIDGGNQLVLVLATDSNGELLWTSPTHVVIVTRDGRITRTLGLPHDLAAVTTPGGFPPPPVAALRAPFTSTRQADFPQLGLYGVSLSCRARLVGRQKIEILGQAITANRVEENCRSQTPDWSFTDIYWLDPDNGLAWRSRQHTHPKGGTVEIEVFRPPG